LPARRAGLNAGGQVYLTPYYVVLHRLGRADIAYNYLPGMYADAHLDLRQVLQSVLLINAVHRQLHGDRAGHRPFRIIFFPDRGAEKDEDRIASNAMGHEMVSVLAHPEPRLKDTGRF
jgi:hypothetical protein